MFPGFEEIMRQAQQMSQNMAQLKQKLASRTVEGTAGGGMVTVTVNGAGQLLRVVIEPDVVDPQDLEMLQDLVVAATNQALEAVREMVAEQTKALTGGVSIPGLENLLGGLGQ